MAGFGAVLGLAVLGTAWAVSRSGPEAVVTPLPEPREYVGLPAFVTDLRPDGGRRSVVRIALVVQVPASDAARLREKHAAIEDALQLHLRDYRRHELEGTEGAARLRYEMLSIVNETIRPAAAEQVLFREFLLD